MGGLAQDLRYALRQLHRNRGFTFVAVITLALGIGANTTMFSVVSSVLLNPLAFPNANRIVSLFQDKANFPKGSLSYPNFLDWQRQNRGFGAMAAYRWADGSVTGAGQAEDVPAQHISATFFPILGVSPILGRNFSADEDRRGANPTVMVSEGFWKRKFASDPNIIGKRLIVAGQVRSIIGVVPASFHLVMQNFRNADVYEPIGGETDPAFFQRDSFWGTDAIGLLKTGVTLEQARDDLKAVNAGLAQAYPDINANIKANMVTLKDEIVGDIRPVLLVLLGAVGFVLLIACVNVANLLLARSTARQREFSVRSALGAGQSRILRQLLTESILLSLLGGLLGSALAHWGIRVALAVAPAGSYASTIPRAEEIGFDVRVLIFTFCMAVGTGILFGLIPALKTARTKISDTLKDAGRCISGSRSRLQAVFVIGEMAMALVLLMGAGLMLRTLMRLWGLDPGFDPNHVITFSLTPPPSLAGQPPDAIRAALRRIVSTIHATPGVQYVSLAWGAQPMKGDNEKGFVTEGQHPTAGQADLPFTLEYVVWPEYLQAMRIPVLRGRFLADQDNEHSPRVAVIDSAFAHEYFKDQDPIGKHVSIFDFDSDRTARTWIPLTIVGVVGHVRQFGLAEDQNRPLQAQLYRPMMQVSDVVIQDAARGMNVFLRYRSALSAELFFQTVRKKLAADNDQMIVSSNESEEEVVARSIASQRFSLVILGAFAGLALLLASIGIYGVLSYLVGQRTSEIGVRMALGAQRLDVLRMVVIDGARMTLAGVVIGLAGAVGLTRLMADMLFGVSPLDPLTFTAVTVGLCGIALFACYLPARRAAKVDPMVALRYE
jgi:predicted permease